MTPRDQISISSQSILWVAGMGVGLLTLTFVLGVQVGKQSEVLRRPLQKSSVEDLKDLPVPLMDQMKLFEGDSSDKLVPAQKVDATAPKAEPKTETAPESDLWTLQLVATSDAAEAKRIVDKAKTAGFATSSTKDKGQIKVRLAKPADRAAMDKVAEKLKKAGFKPFAVKAE
jgi:cell division protein FtsN